jgi:nicotinamidase-related amidase
MKDHTAPEVKPIEPKPVTINSGKSALLVLELSQYLEDPEYFAAPLVPGVTRLLEKARVAGILIVFTIPHPFKGTPQGHVYSGFKRRPHEPLFFPPSFDKFSDGQLQSLLGLYDIDTLIMTGCKANMAVLYTATRAVTQYKYNIVIPIDGIAATTDYEKEYTLYQFRAYPDGSPQRFTYTTLDTISFNTVSSI